MSRSVLVTGGAGFIGSNLVRALLERGDDGSRARQLLDRQPREPGRARGRRRGRRGRAAQLRARPQRRSRRRGRLPPGRAAVRAALGAGSADDERGDDRGDAQRPARGARRGRAPRRLRLVVVGLRQLGDAAAHRDASSPTRSRRTRSPSSRPSATASASTASTGSRRWRSATSTSSARGRTRTSQYAAVVPRFIAAIDDGHPVPIHGDGTQSRDFTYVANVVEANLLAGESGRRQPASC